MRIKKSTTSLTGSEEDDIVLDSAKYHANIRIVQVELSTGEIEYLVTNILDPTFASDRQARCSFSNVSDRTGCKYNT